MGSIPVGSTKKPTEKSVGFSFAKFCLLKCNFIALSTYKIAVLFA